MTAIEQEMNSFMGSPGVSIERNDLSVCGVNHGEIPEQNIDVELAVAMHEIVQKVAKGEAGRICRTKTESGYRVASH